jgi:hypothetical protein
MEPLSPCALRSICLSLVIRPLGPARAPANGHSDVEPNPDVAA